MKIQLAKPVTVTNAKGEAVTYSELDVREEATIADLIAVGDPPSQQAAVFYLLAILSGVPKHVITSQPIAWGVKHQGKLEALMMGNGEAPSSGESVSSGSAS